MGAIRSDKLGHRDPEVKHNDKGKLKPGDQNLVRSNQTPKS